MAVIFIEKNFSIVFYSIFYQHIKSVFRYKFIEFFQFMNRYRIIFESDPTTKECNKLERE